MGDLLDNMGLVDYAVVGQPAEEPGQLHRCYQQFPLPDAVLEDAKPYLKENLELELSSFEDEPLDVELPITVDLTVTDAPLGFAGDTASGATKEVTLETGLKVQTPLFIEEGDVLRIDTRDGRYVTRV